MTVEAYNSDTNRRPFIGLFFKTTWVSQHQKCKPIWILMKHEMMVWQWHQLDHMQIICTLLQTDNHASTSSLNFFTGWMLFLTPSQQCQNTEGSTHTYTQPFLRPFFRDYPGEPLPEENLDFYGAREGNRGRHTNCPAGRHSIQTISNPPLSSLPFLRRMPFLLQP